jgi:hypothetical protein
MQYLYKNCYSRVTAAVILFATWLCKVLKPLLFLWCGSLSSSTWLLLLLLLLLEALRAGIKLRTFAALQQRAHAYQLPNFFSDFVRRR